MFKQNVLINRYVKHEQIFLHIFDNKCSKQYLLRFNLDSSASGDGWKYLTTEYIFMMQYYDGDGNLRGLTNV